VKAAIFKNPDQAPQIVSQSVAALAIGGRLVPQKIPAIARGANVTAVLVKKGQKVKTGQILAVLDVQGKKMKYTATADGVISSLGVSPDLTRLDSDSLALIAQSPECSTTAIRYAILAGFLASPTSITQIVEAAVTAAPSFSDVIIKTAQEAAPDQSDAIAKAAMKAMPPAQATAASASPSPSPLDTNNVIALEQPESGLSPAELDAEHAFNRLKQSGGLSDPKNVQEAVKHVMARHTVTSEIPAPLGAKIIAIYKKNGEIVHTGDKLLTLRLPDGREVPVLAQQDGIMQEIHVSKGGIIGNTRPRSARNEPDTRYDVISVTLRTI
jgi:acetyl/propionyl-CoA carboxylase alpha subunit